MKTTVMTLALSALVLAGACSKDESSTAQSGASAGVSTEAAKVANTELSPEQLGELGAEIKKNPEDAQRLLAQRGLSEEQFEQAVRKVAEDPAASKRYTESYKKAGA